MERSRTEIRHRWPPLPPGRRCGLLVSSSGEPDYEASTGSWGDIFCEISSRISTVVIESASGRALAVQCDVRNEDAIRNIVERAVSEFGRINILVNNAGAIWTQPIRDMSPKRFELMMGINVRASYIAAYYTLPHMVNQQWGHVLNICPPLSVTPSPGKVAYMISKLGMARVAIGLAAEHLKDNIAGNTLWPRTIIESQASINWKTQDRGHQGRRDRT
jgi:citronellol/citronellal dehydrogenase